MNEICRNNPKDGLTNRSMNNMQKSKCPKKKKNKKKWFNSIINFAIIVEKVVIHMSLLESGENYLEAILVLSKKQSEIHAIDIVNETNRPVLIHSGQVQANGHHIMFLPGGGKYFFPLGE